MRMTEAEPLSYRAASFAQDNLGPWSLLDLLAVSRTLRQTHAAFFDALPAGFVVVAESEPLACLALVLAVLMAGRKPALASAAQAGRQTLLPVLQLSSLGIQSLAQLPKPKPTHDGLSLAALVCDPAAATIGFYTSGSTGEGVLLEKSWDALAREACCHRDLFQIGAVASDAGGFTFEQIESMVPPYHLYGFLFSFMLPLVAGARLLFTVGGLRPRELVELAQPPSDIVITVPALWTRIRTLLAAARPPRLIFTSASPLGDEREQEFTESLQRSQSSSRCIEIFGSTDTGGIGYRLVGQGGGTVFRPLPGVELAQSGDAMLIKSPFLFPNGVALRLADRLTLHADSTFEHLGRDDRIVKFAGARCSLAEIEGNLRRLLGDLPVKCFFTERPNDPKGGELMCFIAAEQLDVMALRSAYLQAFSTPFPSRVVIRPELRPNALGKLTAVDLEAPLRPE